MIRPARNTDICTIKELIQRQHAGSKYAGRVGISEKALDQLLLGLVAGQAQSSVGASLVSVAVRDQKVVGFIAGVLQRTYLIGDRLEANDLFFVNEGSAVAASRLVRSYLDWAVGNRKVIEVRMSWTTAIPGADRMTAMFRRRGLKKTGETWAMSTDAVPEGVAA